MTGKTKDESQKDDLGVRIVEIKVNSFSIEEKSLISPEDFVFGVSIALSINKENSLVSSVCGVKIYSSSTGDKELASIEIEIVFNFSSLESYLNTENPKELSDTGRSFIMGETLATTRGIIYALLKNTDLNKAIFPLFDTSQFEKEA